MDMAYTGGKQQGTEQGKKQVADFMSAAKGLGFALGVYATAEKAVNEFHSAKQNRTFSEVDSAWSGREGAVAVNLNKHDLGTVGFGMAAAVLAYSGRKEIKKAFVYGVKGLYKASKRTVSFAKTAIDDLQKYTQENVAEDRANPDKPTLMNKFNKFWGRSER